MVSPAGSTLALLSCATPHYQTCQEAWARHLADADDVGVEVAQVQGHVRGLLVQALQQHCEADRAGCGLRVQQPGLGRLQAISHINARLPGRVAETTTLIVPGVGRQPCT